MNAAPIFVESGLPMAGRHFDPGRSKRAEL